MGARLSRGVGGVLLALVLAAGAASADTLKEQARFRDGPSVDATLLAVLAPGTEVVVMADQRGWRKVAAPDGTVGWIWGDHLAQATPGDAPARSESERPAAPDSPRPPATGPRAVADELRELRADIAALRERPEPASAADVERLRSEIDRLVAEQRNLARRIDDRRYPGTGGVDIPTTRPFPRTVVAALLIGALGGLLIGRLARRRDRRTRSRLSF